VTSSDSAPKKTPLYDRHLKAGAKIIDFGGWLMPVQYSGIVDEHHTVRNAVGVFDVSHMGEVFVRGPQAGAWLNSLLANNVRRLCPGQCQYTFLLNENAGVIDDLLLYRTAPEEYLLVVNASEIDKDVAWLRAHLAPGVELEDKSDDYAGLAVQGPRAVQLFERLFGDRHQPPARNEIMRIDTDCLTLLIARTGYTGEDGFEIFFAPEHAAAVWDDLLLHGADLGIKPCGLGARDTLRLEMCYPLYGSDLSLDRSPLEAGLSFFIDLEKPEFIGRGALLAQRTAGVSQRLVPFRMTDKSPPPRSHYGVFKNGEKIAETASGSLSPSLGAGIGMAYLPAAFARAGEAIEIEIRARRYPAVVEKRPLYRK